MDQVGSPRYETILSRFPHRVLRWTLIVIIGASAALVVAILLANVQRPSVILALVVGLAACTVAFAFALTSIGRQLHREQRVTTNALEATEEEFRQMAGNIQEIFWMIDAKARKALYVNKAYEAITGRSGQSLIENPSSRAEVIHPDDRVYVLAKVEEATQAGHFDERFRIIRPEGSVRWVWVRGFPVRDSKGNIARLVGTALDISAQKQAEEQVVVNLAIAKTAWQEEEALRKATLALTQDLHMNKVMDALLGSLAEVVPYTCARVMVPEGGPHWLTLGERACAESAQTTPEFPWTFVDDKCALVRRVAEDQKSILISDTRAEGDWVTSRDTNTCGPGYQFL